MAAIVPTNLAVKNLNGQRAVNVRTETAQGTTGQTDWIRVPAWAAYMKVYVSVSAMAGNADKKLLAQILTTDPKLLDDATDGTGGGQLNIGSGPLTGGITSNGNTCITVGPNLTGIADVLAFGASGGTNAHINSMLPQLVGIQIVNVRTTGDETYTYKVNVEFFE